MMATTTAATTATCSKTCTNKGCGQTFSDDTNAADACRFHSYGPIFHEGLKGWGCCNKRVISFDEFLAIPGCQVGFHSDAVAVEEQPPAKNDNKKATATATATRVDTASGQVVEVYGSSSAVPQPTTKPAVTAPVVDTKVPVVDEEDPADAAVSEGAKCKRNGCDYAFCNDSTARCTFHPGTPIFHEGSKGWSCCARKVLEFDEFLKIRGCKEGRHMFIGAPAGPAAESVCVECRHDWYQSPTHVTISLYAKKVGADNAKITFEREKLIVKLVLPDGNRVEMDMQLFQPIEPEQSSFKVMNTKVEVTLRKANGISWPSLEPTSNLTSWTTFGTTGTVGTVGSKEMQLSNDSPILAASVAK